MFQPTMLPARLSPLALGLAVSLSGPPRATASTVVVPDDSSTVTSAIASGADTVLVREGIYTEAPVVDRDLVLKGIGVSSRPRLNGLQLTNLNTYNAGTFVSGFDVSGTVAYGTVRNKSPISVSISDCSMDGGVQVSAYAGDIALSLVRCRMAYAYGGNYYNYDGRGVDAIFMEADTLEGGVSWNLLSAGPVSIQHCWFRGHGVGPWAATGPAITLTTGDALSGWVSYNRIENYAYGISVTEGAMTIEGNTISGCGVGIAISGPDVSGLAGNRILNGNIGISVDGNVTLVNNTIIGASAGGVSVRASDSFDAEQNVIGDCGGAGIHVDWDAGAYTGGLLQGNTIFKCAGSAMELSWTPAFPYGSVSIVRNIGFGSGAWGLSISGTQFRDGCNDWYSNHSGNVTGIVPDATDLSLDPMFCNVDSADVRLNSASPLLADTATCGQIGALGVGCGVTATLVQRFTAGRVNDGVRVVWQVAAGATASAIWVERAEGATGQAWTRPVMERSTDGQAVVELDTSALPDHAYRYRLVAVDGGRLLVLDPGILVEAQARLSFALAEVGPSPGGGPLRIAFTLARDAQIEIAVYDLLGRRVATAVQGAWPAGAQVVQWDGRTPAGVYVVQYAYPGGRQRRTIVRVR